MGAVKNERRQQQFLMDKTRVYALVKTKNRCLNFSYCMFFKEKLTPHSFFAHYSAKDSYHSRVPASKINFAVSQIRRELNLQLKHFVPSCYRIISSFSWQKADLVCDLSHRKSSQTDLRKIPASKTYQSSFQTYFVILFGETWEADNCAFFVGEHQCDRF